MVAGAAHVAKLFRVVILVGRSQYVAGVLRVETGSTFQCDVEIHGSIFPNVIFMTSVDI